MTTPSPACTVNSGTPPTAVTGGSTVTIALALTAGVGVWFLQAIACDDSSNLSTIEASLSINPVTKTATFTAPSGLGSAVIFQSTVGAPNSNSAQGVGRDVNGTIQPSYTTTFKVNVLTASGLAVLVPGEVLEQDSANGHTNEVNAVIRLAGGTFSNPAQFPNSVTGTAEITWQKAASGAGGTLEIVGQHAATGSNASGGSIVVAAGQADGSYAGDPSTVTVESGDALGGVVCQSDGVFLSGAGAVQWSTFLRTINANYTVDSGADSFGGSMPDGTLVVDTSGGAVAITLPAPGKARRLRIIDKTNSFATHNCTLVRHASEKIDNVAATKTLSTNGFRGFIDSDGTNWWVG